MTHDVSPKQLAAATGLSAAFIYREIARGHLAAYRAGNRLRIEPGAVAAWKEQRKVDPRRGTPMYEPETSPQPGKPEGRFTSDLKAIQRTA
jgi:excisionase family DNA binding protein